ncbi:hypothetical protein ACFU6I_17695 [Streptomyces sp. NPDC057486]
MTGRPHIHWYAQVFGIYYRCFCGHWEMRPCGPVLSGRPVSPRDSQA